MFFSFRRFDAENQHVLGEPALFAREIRTDAQRETFFAQQHIAAVTGADRDDRVVLRKMADEAAIRIDIEQRMHAAIPFRLRIAAEPLDRDLPHARHDSHAEHDVYGIGDFESDFRERRIRRPHDVGHDKHGAPAHRALEQAVQFRICLGRLRPIVRRARFLFRRRADQGELLDPGDVVRIRAMQIRAREPFSRSA